MLEIDKMEDKGIHRNSEVFHRTVNCTHSNVGSKMMIFGLIFPYVFLS